jgi:TolA-binding protein
VIRAATLLAVLAAAPLQCPSRQTASSAREESPPEALWDLAERFAAQGDPRAARATLSYLNERYPSSRYAERARLALADAGSP